jgi:transposase-like protein
MQMALVFETNYDLEQLQLRTCPHCKSEVNVGNLESISFDNPICQNCNRELYPNGEQETEEKT